MSSNSTTATYQVMLMLMSVTRLSADPSKTVRTSIVGKYNSHHYNYKPDDMAICEWPSIY